MPFETLAERGFYGIAAVACLELLVWRRRDPVELEHSGTERLRAARLLTMRRIALLAAVLLSLVYTASTLRTADGSPEVQNLVFRTVITALAACTMPMALELYFWIHRRPTGTEEPMIGDRSRASARIAGRLLVYLPVVCILYLVVFSYVGLPIPSGVPEIQTRAQFAKIVEAALEGVVKGVTVGAVAGMLVGYLASPTHGIALGFIGAMAGGLALGTTSRNAPTLLLMIALFIALLWPLLTGGMRKELSAGHLAAATVVLVVLVSIYAQIEKGVKHQDFLQTEGLIRGVALGLILGLCRGAAESVLLRKRMKYRMGLLGAMIVGTIVFFSTLSAEQKAAAHSSSGPIASQTATADSAARSSASHTATANRSARASQRWLPLLAGLVLGASYLVGVLRIYYHAVHPLFVMPNPTGAWYPRHPVAWDDLCSVSFPGLHRLLVAYAELEPEAASTEISRLIAGYDSQKAQALLARAVLLMRQSGRVQNLSELGPIFAELARDDFEFLRKPPKLNALIGEIVSLHNRLRTIDRPTFREPTARELCTMIDRFRYQVDNFQEPWATEFRLAAECWLRIARKLLGEAAAVVEKEPTPQVFARATPSIARPRHSSTAQGSSAISSAW